MGIIIAFVILGVIIVGIVSGGVAIYNRLVMLKYNVDKNFANIDVILKQRVDEIPLLPKGRFICNSPSLYSM